MTSGTRTIINEEPKYTTVEQYEMIRFAQHDSMGRHHQSC